MGTKGVFAGRRSGCGACADGCPGPASDQAIGAPWTLIAKVGAGCLAADGIVCEVCRDSCPTAAIRLRPIPGHAATSAIDGAACTGCVTCIPHVPTAAIESVAAAPVMVDHDA